MTSSHFSEAVRLGAGAARRNLLPGAMLWAVGIVLVVSYYQVPQVASFLDRVGVFKEEHSPWVGMLSTALFGSLVPWAAARLFVRDGEPQPFRQASWLFLFWAIHGWQVDLLYQVQAHFFGHGIDAVTIVKKMLVDEFVWVPFLAVPQLVFGYLLIEKDFSLVEFRAALARRSFLQRAIPLMLANWVVWIPACSLVYLFPLPLQLPLMNIVLGIWCLIILFFSQDQEPPSHNG